MHKSFNFYVAPTSITSYNRLVVNISGDSIMKYIAFCIMFFALFFADAVGDVFKEKTTGEVFYGYSTGKRMGDKNRIYVLNAEKLTAKTMDLSNYDVSYDRKGRRNNVIVIAIKIPEVMVSKNVSDILIKTIRAAANKGPRYILFEIDSQGGHGSYMKEICNSIVDAGTCPTVAYVSGGSVGGAYSTAAGLVMACDKVYISPDAAIGSVAPAVGSVMSAEQLNENIQQFSNENLAIYGSFVGTLATDNNRPAVLAQAFVDKTFEIVEVQTDENGKREFIKKLEKKPYQAVVRTWTRTVNQQAVKSALTATGGSQFGQAQSIAGIMAINATITLNAKQAVYCGIADKITESENEVLIDLGAEDAKVLKSSVVKNAAKKFNAYKSNMERVVTNIVQLEDRAMLIDNKINDLFGPENRTMIRRNVGKVNLYDSVNARRKRSTSRRGQASTSQIYSQPRRMYAPDERLRSVQRSQPRSRGNEVIIESNSQQINSMVVQLAYVLDDLIVSYRSAIVIEKKSPGTLPYGMSMQSLQRGMTAAQTARRSSRFSGIIF
jgi:ATP-dependent protease ClpP protease subunit